MSTLWNRAFAIALTAWTTSCARPCPPPATASPPLAIRPLPTSGAAPSSTAPAGAGREVAVLPLEDDRLFRAERKQVREWAARQIAAHVPEHTVLPFGTVDAKLAARSKSGARCAFEHAPRHRRARAQGWLATDFLEVMGIDGNPPELWLELHGHDEHITLTARWDEHGDRLERYRKALSSLERPPSPPGALNGLAASGLPRGAVHAGALTLCERTGPFQCTPETRSFSDRAAEFAKCFASMDELELELLFDTRGASRCEIAGLDDASGAERARERCLCTALDGSAGKASKSARRTLALHYESPDLAGKPRPELRVIEVSPNLASEEDHHMRRTDRDAKARSKPVMRLTVDHLDALAAPLARCAIGAGQIVVADLEVSESGTVKSARVLPGGTDAARVACVEKALGRAAFWCTSDGQTATLRIAIEG